MYYNQELLVELEQKVNTTFRLELTNSGEWENILLQLHDVYYENEPIELFNDIINQDLLNEYFNGRYSNIELNNFLDFYVSVNKNFITQINDYIESLGETEAPEHLAIQLKCLTLLNTLIEQFQNFDPEVFKPFDAELKRREKERNENFNFFSFMGDDSD